MSITNVDELAVLLFFVGMSGCRQAMDMQAAIAISTQLMVILSVSILSPTKNYV